MGNEIFRYLRKYFRGLALWKDLSTIPHNQIQSNKALLKIECNTALKARTNYMFCAGFFNAKNFFSIFLDFNLTNHTCHSLYGAERGITTFQVIAGKGVGL